MAKVERVPVTRLITIGGYVTNWELDQIIKDLDEDVSDDAYSHRGKVKITIEFTED